MKRLKEIVTRNIKGISLAGFRFPMTVLSLLVVAGIFFAEIAVDVTMPLLLEKIRLTFVVGSVLGIAAQFAVERFQKVSRKRMAVYGVALLLLVGYFLILLPAPKMSNDITVSSLVAVFALTCMVLWIPSYKSQVNFNLTALIHFKSFFTSLLYAGVLTAGLVAIVGAVDILLFQVFDDIYGYILTVIWVVFAPIYYLSLLPKFNSQSVKDQSMTERISSYPRFLEILISNIAIPLISAYTLVLFAYFLKILFTLEWPSGQVGVMVLIYAIAGLFIFILSSLLENRWALFYRKLFPKILIPVVIMQLISVGIRLNTYGITESRYYMIIFGIFSIIAGIILNFSKVLKNERIALLAAIFAIISIIPPVDAFTLSRYSQINRIESILENEGMLVEGKLIRKEEASEYTKIETTDILYYLQGSSSLAYIDWLPKDFKVYDDLEEVFGFEPTHSYATDNDRAYINIYLDEEQPLPVSGYDVLLNTSARRYMKAKEINESNFEFNGKTYGLKVSKISNKEVRVSILDALGTELVGTGLHTFAEGFVGDNKESKGVLSPEEMSFDVLHNEYKLRIIFRNIDYILGDDSNSGIDYNFYVLFAVPK